MVIEWKRVRVKPEARDRWLEKDREIWTVGLAREEGFLGKEVWLGDGSEVIVVIHWRTEEDWKGIPQERLDGLTRRFSEAFPEDDWERLETRCYQVVQAP